jgi:hypothetical protein
LFFEETTFNNTDSGEYSLPKYLRLNIFLRKRLLYKYYALRKTAKWGWASGYWGVGGYGGL